MIWRPLIGLVLLSSPALAQQNLRPGETPYQGSPPQYQLYRACISLNGLVVPCNFTDTPTPDVSPPLLQAVPTNKSLVVQMSPNSGLPDAYPPGSTPVTAAATGTTAATAASLAAIPNFTNYVCGFSVSPGSAATAITISEVLSGIKGGSMTWAVGAPVTAVGITGAILTETFRPCIPASAANTAITMTSGALGTSGINNDVQLWGYYK